MRFRRGFLVFAAAAGLIATWGSAEERVDPKTYGTTSLSFYRVGFSEFSPELSDSNTSYSHLILGGIFARYPTGGSGVFVAVPHLPSGALLDSVELDYCDTNAAWNLRLEVWGTSYLGNNLVSLGQVSSSGSEGCSFSTTDVSAANFVVDNNLNQIVLRAEFFPVFDPSVAITGAIMRYRLQVSPDPVTATFGDVPVGHPQHQFVEALVAAGVTAGCGGGNFCPAAPLTRGQMAVFLSKALGLHWQ